MSSIPLRILHVVNSLDPGGMENGVVNMAGALEQQGVEIHVACLERRGAFADRLPNPGRVTVLGKTDGFSPLAAARLAKLIIHLRPALVHSHNLGALIYAAFPTAGGRFAPVLQGEHSQLTPAELTPRRIRQRRWLYRCCRGVHTVAHPMRDELIALGFAPEKICVIPNGVDTTRFCPGDRTAARGQLDLPEDGIVLGIVGRFGPFKRHSVLLDAFDNIAARFPFAHLAIAGSGGSEENATRARTHASPHAARIHWLGFQSDPATCYRALDLLVIPSINEGLSNVALEAMSSGIPVLANTGCGHEHIFTTGREGVIADLSTPAFLTIQLTNLLAQPEQLIDFGKKARTRICGHFSLGAMADAYATLYRALANRC
ncbi:MAG: glycosyltransferase [Chthoniobacter sp.]|nr:glycosyltransferase [Chthoniobacter sp.]